MPSPNLEIFWRTLALRGADYDRRCVEAALRTVRSPWDDEHPSFAAMDCVCALIHSDSLPRAGA
jgi:hypothetical protein